MSARRRAGAALLALAAACAPDREPAGTTSVPPPLRPDRPSFAAFRALHPDLPEPNYLPFLLHRFPGLDGGPDVLAFCRWSDDRLPLAVAIEPPRIPAALENEFVPRPPEVFVRAVERALAAWEEALAGRVRFLRVAPGSEPALRLRLLGEVAPSPEPDVAVLGTTSLGGACRAQGFAGGGERLDVRYEVTEVRLYVADRFGLLTEAQVHRVALHEIGHALGMRGHSPIPADLMYEVARDGALADALTAEDVHSFQALYSIPNGTVYGRVVAEPASDEAPPAAGPPPGDVRLGPEPRLVARHGLSVRLPERWMQIESPHGLIAIDGVTWDYDASLQLIVRPYESADAYLARHGAAHVGEGSVLAQRPVVVSGHHGVQLVVEGRLASVTEEVTVIELPGERVLVVIADCPTDVHARWAPWFDAIVRSLEIRPPHDGA